MTMSGYVVNRGAKRAAIDTYIHTYTLNRSTFNVASKHTYTHAYIYIYNIIDQGVPNVLHHVTHYSVNQ